MPRPYSLGKRAAQVEQTRSRLIEAAIDLSIERGISAVTMLQVARRADVAPGTAFNHFPSREALDEALAERALAEMDLPGPGLIDPRRPLPQRILQLAEAVGAFIERAGRWYRMWLREPMLTGPWLAAGEAAGAAWDRAFRDALGPLAGDDDAMDVLGAAMQPRFFEVVAAGRRTPDATAALVAEAITPWLLERRRARNWRRA